MLGKSRVLTKEGQAGERNCALSHAIAISRIYPHIPHVRSAAVLAVAREESFLQDIAESRKQPRL